MGNNSFPGSFYFQFQLLYYFFDYCSRIACCSAYICSNVMLIICLKVKAVIGKNDEAIQDFENVSSNSFYARNCFWKRQ